MYIVRWVLCHVSAYFKFPNKGDTPKTVPDLLLYTAFTLQKSRMVTVLQPFHGTVPAPFTLFAQNTNFFQTTHAQKNRHVHAVRPRIHVRTCAQLQRSIINN